MRNGRSIGKRCNDYLAVLHDFDLLDQLPKGGTIAGSVLPDDTNLLRALSLWKGKGWWRTQAWRHAQENSTSTKGKSRKEQGKKKEEEGANPKRKGGWPGERKQGGRRQRQDNTSSSRDGQQENQGMRQ